MKTKDKARALVNIQSLSEPQRARYRRRAFECYREGLTKYAAAKKLGVHETTVGRWYRRFGAQGEAAVHGGKRGPKPGGEKHKLSDAQMAELKRTVMDKTPDQLKFDFALWSSRAVKEYVEARYGVKIHRRTARRYMQRMGFTYQIPVRAARERDREAVGRWLAKEYPAIRDDAATCGASIFWGDESTVMACETKARGYSPKGVSPVLAAPANRAIRCNMVSAVSNKGEMHFMCFDGAMNADIFKEFMARLMEDVRGMVFLVVDNLKVHHANCLEEWLEEHRDRIRLFFLPSYSPELNPDEYLNRDVKAAMSEKRRPSSAKAMRDIVSGHLQARKDDPESIRRLFHKKEVQYAAEQY